MREFDPQINLEIAEDILRYFLRNPQAADDLEGIVRWRLLDERVHRNLTQVSVALKWLISKGLLIEERAGTAGPVYRLNAERRVEGERFLEDVGIRKSYRQDE